MTFNGRHGRILLMAILMLSATSIAHAAQSAISANLSVSPTSGTGLSQTFAITVSHSQSVDSIDRVWVIINSGLEGANACYITFLRFENTLWLSNSSGSAWLAPAVVGGEPSLSNNQCSLRADRASVRSGVTEFTIYLPLTFSASFGGVKNIYAQAADISNQGSGWRTVGTWTVSDGNAAPVIESVTPASGSGLSQTFSVTVSDAADVTAISQVWVIINNEQSGANGCYISYVRSGNTLWLADNSGAWQAPAVVGSGVSLGNSQCSVNPASATVTTSGTRLTINLPLTFSTSFSGAKSVYALVLNNTGQNSGWQSTGTWTVTASAPPSVDSVSPSSGTGLSQTFSVRVSDAAGVSAISQVWVIINSTQNEVNGCYISYARSANTLWLANDPGAWEASAVVGTGSSLSNSQCSLNPSAATAPVSGNQLTINLPLTFTASFTGLKNIYVLVADNFNQRSGWQNNGTWTVGTAGGGGSDDHGNTCSTATVIAPTGSTGGRIEAIGDIDFFRIELGQAGVLTLSTTGNLDTVGDLYDSSCKVIAENDDAAPNGQNKNFRIVSSTLNPGTYYVSVRYYSNSSNGPYTLVSSFSPQNGTATTAIITPGGTATTLCRQSIGSDVGFVRLVRDGTSWIGVGGSISVTAAPLGTTATDVALRWWLGGATYGTLYVTGCTATYVGPAALATAHQVSIDIGVNKDGRQRPLSTESDAFGNAHVLIYDDDNLPQQCGPVAVRITTGAYTGPMIRVEIQGFAPWFPPGVNTYTVPVLIPRGLYSLWVNGRDPVQLRVGCPGSFVYID